MIRSVVDCRAIKCNRREVAQLIVSDVQWVLKPGGWFWSSMLTDRTCARETGRQIDPGGGATVPDGPLAGLDFNLLLDIMQVDALYCSFPLRKVGRSSITADEMRYLVDAWNIEAQKAP